MFKKIKNITRTLIISTVFSIVYFATVHFMFLKLWNFNILITDDWLKVAKFWNQGGVIRKLNDFMFVLAILLIFPLWFYLLLKVIKQDYLNIFFYPVFAYNRYITKKYGADSKRIILKNLGNKKKELTLEDMVNIRMKETEKNKDKELEATKIRNIIREKMEKRK